jgi:hypothetical protein
MPPKKIIKEALASPAKEESKSVLRFLLSLNTNRVPLDFGINLNCRLIKIDNTPRIREGETIKKNTFLSIAKYNSKNEIVGQTEFSFFNLDPESKFTFDNFVQQLSQLTNIVEVLSPGSTYDPTSDFDSTEDLEAALTTPKGCKELQNKMYDMFEEIVGELVGPESPLLAVKAVTEKTGKYLQLPREGQFCALMDGDYSMLKVTPFELKTKNASLSPSTAVADEKGEAPNKEKSKMLENL